MTSPYLLQHIYEQLEALSAKLPGTMYFHNWQHTQNVFLAATEIAQKSNLGNKDTLIVQIAALFHDMGYLYIYDGHEETSKLIASNFLLQENVEESLIDAVLQAINATKMPQTPQSEVECILCDADLFHIALKEYPEYAEKLRKEWQAHFGKQFTDSEWCATNLNFLQQHRYCSNFGKEVLEPLKQLNILKLQQQLATYA